MKQRPNIILILLDDMGQRDLSCYGSEFYETPNIDALASEGMLFTNAYASCPVCSPSRASIMSGKYPARVGVTDFLVSNAKGMLIDAEYTHHLPLEEKSLASALGESGYTTWHIGKWHLGTEPYYPEKHGFDINIGGCEFGLPRSGYMSPYHIPTLKDGPKGEYLTDRITDEAIQLLKEWDKKQPFYMNLWHYAVHVPIQAPDERVVEKYRQKAFDMGVDKVQTFAEGDYFPCEHKRNKRIVRRLIQSDPQYAAMIENLDDNIGRLIKVLKDMGIYEDTAIIFTSDNGGLATAEGSPTCNLPLVEGKGWMYEGGVRVPLIVKSDLVRERGTKTDKCVTSPDLYPFILDLAGVGQQPDQHVDGKSFLPVLRNQDFERGPIFWHYPHYGNQGGTPCCAVREGRYKLIYFFENKESELYDLEEDSSEKYNLSDELPEIVQRLRDKLFKWLDDIEAEIPAENPDFVPWREGFDSGKEVELPFDLEKYDADVYYGLNMDHFH